MGGDGLVIPIHHSRLVAKALRVPKITASRFGDGPVIFQATAHLGGKSVTGTEGFCVLQRHQEQMGAFLDVRHVGRPKQVHHVHTADVNIPQPILKARIPKDTVRRHTVLELAPRIVGIGFIKSAVFHDDGNHVRQHGSIILVTLLSGKHTTNGIVVTKICVLMADTVKQPGGQRSFFAGSAVPTVAISPPHLLVVQTAVKSLLARSVLLQYLRRLFHVGLGYVSYAFISLFCHVSDRCPLSSEGFLSFYI